MARGDWAASAREANALKYQIVRIKDGDDWYVVASDDSGSGLGPTVVVNTSPDADIVLQAPHVPFERGTAEQAALLLTALRARAAIVSGAHRCASRNFTACDGKTSVCGTQEGYRATDVSHNIGTPFHVAHVVFAETWPGSLAVSLHGMREDSEGVATSLIVSNGIRAADTKRETPATQLRFKLAERFLSEGAVASCNWPDDTRFDYRKLCGYTNVQGRHINGDGDACRDSVDEGTGRFIHIEQDWTVLRPFAESWGRGDSEPVIGSILAAFRAIVPKLNAEK